MALIGLTGGNGTGKSSIARALARGDMGGYVVLGFADPIRAAVAAALGEPVAKVFAHPRKDQPHPAAPGGATPRQLAICWGGAARQEFGSECWVRALESRARRHGPKVVVDDLRFRVEAEWIKANRGVIVCLGQPPGELSLADCDLLLPACPPVDEGPVAQVKWLAAVLKKILPLLRDQPPPPWWGAAGTRLVQA